MFLSINFLKSDSAYILIHLYYFYFAFWHQAGSTKKFRMNKEHHITYQTFPSNKANTFQTMDNIKYFEKNGYQVKLTFPLREKSSTSNKDILKKFYPISNKLEINGEVIIYLWKV